MTDASSEMKGGENTGDMANGANGGDKINIEDEDLLTTASSVVTPDMLYKLSKKIAQLTKVIYSLNTRNDDLEVDLEAVRATFEEKLQLCQEQLQIAHNHTTVANDPILANVGTHEIEVVEAKKELAEAVQALKLSESKVKAMENEISAKQVQLDQVLVEVQKKQTPISEASCQTQQIHEAAKSDTKSKQLALLEQQVKQFNKEKQELAYRVDRLDILNESLRLESETHKKEIKEVTTEKNKLQLELSAARIQINYDKEVGKDNHKNSAEVVEDAVDSNRATLDDKFTDDLLQKVECLINEKAELSKALEEAKVGEIQFKKQLETSKQTQMMEKHMQMTSKEKQIKNRGQQTDVVGCDGCESKTGEIRTLETQVGKLQIEKSQYEQRLDEVTRMAAEGKAAESVQHETDLDRLRSETQQLQAMLERETERSRVELAQLDQQLKAKQADLDTSREDYEAVKKQVADIEAAAKADRDNSLQAAQATRESLQNEVSESKDRELEIKIEMGQNSEKLCAVEERCKSIEKERDDLKRKCKEVEARMDVLSRSEQAAEKDVNERLTQLEKALEEALIEREEILEAAEKEIQAQKTIALETEQKMMDDFEWKLREIESEYREKIKTIEDNVDSKVKAARSELTRQKDEEFTRMSISMRREMEDKIRVERNNLKTALDTHNAAERDKAIELYRLEKDHDMRLLQKTWEEEQVRLNREIRTMQRKVDSMPQEILAATRTLRSECDVRVQEERRKIVKVEDRSQEDYDKLRDEMNGEIRRVQVACDESIAEYEAKLQVAHGNRLSSMFQMKEEVEVEFSDRMEQLSDIYKREMSLQSDRFDEERTKANQLEVSLRHSIKDHQQEIDDLNTYYTSREDELETKINDLLLRLQDHTALAIKLQAELDEYEWYEEEEEVVGEDAAAAAPETPSRPPSSRSQHRPHSRPTSTKPLDQHKFPSSTITEEEAASSAAHHNYVSMTSLNTAFATAPTSTSSSSSSLAAMMQPSSPHTLPRSSSHLRAASDATCIEEPPLAEEAFLTEATATTSSMTLPTVSLEQPQQHTKRNSALMSNGSSSKKSQCSQQ